MKHITIKLTPADLVELIDCVERHITWGIGGKYGDGTDIWDAAGLKRAKSLVKLLQAHLDGLR